MFVTVFTPTYNRGYIISELYKSLCSQTSKNFEWIVIDDASGDNTSELISEFKNNDNGFEIVYYKQEHGGKHRAINRALKMAKGEMFFIVDSDDKITPDAVEFIEAKAAEIIKDDAFAGISGLRIYSDGNIIGGNPEISNDSFVDATNFERRKYKLLGDKSEIYKTDVMKKFPFPEFDGEYFVTEAVCWDAIAANGYKLRWFNKPLYICEYLDDGLTKTGANNMSGNISNYNGFCYYIRQCLKVKKKTESVHNFLTFEKTARIMKKTLTQKSHDLEISKLSYLVSLFVMVPVICGFKKILKIFKRKNKA